MRKILKQIFELADGYQANLKRMFVYMVLKNICSLFMIWAVMLALSYVVLFETNGVMISSKNIQTTIIFLCISLVGKILFGYLSDHEKYYTSYSLGASNRIIIGDRLKHVSMGFFKSQRLGDLVSGISQGIEYVETIGFMIVMLYYTGLIQTCMMLVFVLPYDFISFCIILIGLLVSMHVTKITQDDIDSLTMESVDVKLNLNASILDYVQGIGVIKSFGQNKVAIGSVEDAIHKTRSSILSIEKVAIQSLTRSTIILRLTSVVLLVVTLLRYNNGSIDLVKTLMLAMSSFIVFAGFELSESMQNFRGTATSAIQKVNELLHVEVMEEGEKTNVVNPTGKFNHVDFGYHDTLLFEDLNVMIQKHQTIALVGYSGSGKTTLCNLLARFYDVNKGEVFVDDTNVKQYVYDDLLSKFSFVFQDVYLFDDTIRNNICFGNMNASEEEMIDVCKKARCHEFISELEDGYDTMLIEGGKNLSGGQRQRIAIARAMLKESDFVVLDEATSNIDPENEVKLLAALKELLKKKTVLIIAHKLKTIQDADCVLVLKDGAIVQRGTFDELVNQEGVLREFVEERKQSEIWQVNM